MWMTAFSIIFVGSFVAIAAIGHVLLLNATIFKRSKQQEENVRQATPAARRIIAAA